MTGETCTQVLEVLSYLPIEEYNKIPDEIIQNLYENSDESITVSFNPNEDIKKQNISQSAIYVIAYITKSFLSDDLQKEEIIKYEQEYQKIIDEGKHSGANLFKEKEEIKEEREEKIIEYKKETFLDKINKILKKIFKNR